MIAHVTLSPQELRSAIRSRAIVIAGNKRLRIFGELSCYSGKRMKKENRVFFASEAEAMAVGFRPCGHCRKEQFHLWKKHAR